MPPLDLAPSHLAELCELLTRHVPDAAVWAFGSRVNGSAHEGSDLDLVLRNTQEPTLPVAGMTALQEALQASGLPMLMEAHDWSQLPASFHAAIERGYVVIQPGRHVGSLKSSPHFNGDPLATQMDMRREWE